MTTDQPTADAHAPLPAVDTRSRALPSNVLASFKAPPESYPERHFRCQNHIASIRCCLYAGEDLGRGGPAIRKRARPHKRSLEGRAEDECEISSVFGLREGDPSLGKLKREQPRRAMSR